MAKFLENGNCGYVLRPDFMFTDGFAPSDPSSSSAAAVEPITLVVRVIAARHLSRGGGPGGGFGGRSVVAARGLISPFVEVEVVGAAPFDCARFKTKTISDNGLCPLWDEVFNFRVQIPELAFLR